MHFEPENHKSVYIGQSPAQSPRPYWESLQHSSGPLDGLRRPASGMEKEALERGREGRGGSGGER